VGSPTGAGRRALHGRDRRPYLTPAFQLLYRSGGLGQADGAGRRVGQPAAWERVGRV